MSDNIHPSSPVEGVYEEEFHLPAAPADVFSALTQEQQLAVWFAERAHVEPRVGGRFYFGGRHTPYVLDSDPPQRLSVFEAPSRLSFEWFWGGAWTLVSLTLAATPGGTLLRIRHELGASKVGKDQRESTWLAHDFWGLSVGNLEHFLRTGKPALLPDHGSVQQDAQVAIEIDAPIDSVWQALTDPKELRQWMEAVAPEVELRVGGKYTYGWQVEGAPCGPTEILELDPPRLLVVRWSHKGDSSDRTEWRLCALSPTKTRVLVKQARTATTSEFHGYTNGWAKFLFALRCRVLRPASVA